ncbi:MAG: hypothetical protein GY863_16855 [bacterium]|nr:hypothetical protein [bacterium]
MPAGAVVSVFLIHRYKVQSRHTPYLEHACNSLWFACGFAFFIVAFFGSFSPIVTYKAISPVCALIAGIGMLSLGIILDWKLLRLAGVAWWVSAVLMMFIPYSYQGMTLAVTVIPGYLIPGYALRKQN